MNNFVSGDKDMEIAHNYHHGQNRLNLEKIILTHFQLKMEYDNEKEKNPEKHLPHTPPFLLSLNFTPSFTTPLPPLPRVVQGGVE